jgi:hypothetical protein
MLEVLLEPAGRRLYPHGGAVGKQANCQANCPVSVEVVGSYGSVAAPVGGCISPRAGARTGTAGQLTLTLAVQALAFVRIGDLLAFVR